MRVVVTGGASFIGSHLVERLVADGHQVRVIDNFTSGSGRNLQDAYQMGLDWRGQVICLDLRIATPSQLAKLIQGYDLVYHLAADHGGRGYVEKRQIATSNNFAIDNNLFQAAVLAGTPRIIYASSGCIYPKYLQEQGNVCYLGETDDGSNPNDGYDPDGLYGLAKLAGELTLQRLYQECGIESVSCRFFTVYGPRAKENHAIISFIARAFIQRDPWLVWGDGTQVRNWTHVDDIVNGLVLSQSLSGCESLNLGTMETITVDQAVAEVLQHTRDCYYPDYNPEIQHDLTMPTGPMVRVADNFRYLQLGGHPLTPFTEGVRSTLDWYFQNKNRDWVEQELDRLLVDRR